MAIGGVYSAEGILKIAFVIHRVVFLLNLLHAMFLGRSLTISSLFFPKVRKTSISSSTKNNLKETSSPRLLGYRPFFGGTLCNWRHVTTYRKRHPYLVNLIGLVMNLKH